MGLNGKKTKVAGDRQYRYQCPADANLELSDSELSDSAPTVEPIRKRSRKNSWKTKDVGQSCSENWTPQGSSFICTVHYRNDSKPPSLRNCYGSIRHRHFQLTIATRDCVLVRSDDSSQPFVGKIIRIFEDLDGDLKINLLWYYRSSDVVSQPQLANNIDDSRELFASRHLDVISADCIDGVAKVLAPSEFNRFMASRQATVEGLSIEAQRQAVPFSNPIVYDEQSDMTGVFYCRKSYNYRHFKLNRVVIAQDNV